MFLSREKLELAGPIIKEKKSVYITVNLSGGAEEPQAGDNASNKYLRTWQQKLLTTR